MIEREGREGREGGRDDIYMYIVLVERGREGGRDGLITLCSGYMDNI